ncbi:MAG: hypothetical protein AB8H47_06365 [Bacteroidia bacterium]
MILLSFSTACFDLVDEGIRVEYPASNASMTVEAIATETGAENDMISYEITVSSQVDIKSCVVQTTNEGQSGTGYNVADPNYDDPFADHGFGTMRKNVQSFKIRYDYIIPSGINKSRLTFSVVDESGIVSVEKTLEVVPGIESYSDKNIYARDSDFFDGFASVDGVVYPDIKTNFNAVSEENLVVQKKLDIVFYYDPVAKRSTLTSPAADRAGLNLSVENKTLFKRLNNQSGLILSELSPGELINLSGGSSAMLQDGAEAISQLVVGDVIAYITDLNADYSLKIGLLKVTGLHPASVPHYSGVSYVLECDIIVQK